MSVNLSSRMPHALSFCVLIFLSFSTHSQTPQLEWVQQYGNNTVNTHGKHVIIDSNRAIVSAGTFRQTVDFDAGPGSHTLTASGTQDVFLAKHDTAGHFIWAKSIGGTLDDDIQDMKFDREGNLLVLGMFQGTVDLDPGPGVQQFTSSGTNNFLLKLDNNGNFIWVRTFLLHDMNCLEIDRNGDILIGGDFGGTMDFDPGAGVFNMTAGNIYEDLFVMKLDGDANFI